MRQVVGAGMVLLVLLPVHRLLAGAETGLAGEVVHGWTDVHRTMLFSGMLLLLVPAILSARMLSWPRVEQRARRAAAWLARPSAHRFALAAAVVAGVVTTAFSFLVLEARPNLIDSIVQLLHARFWAEGQLAGPVLANEFWHIQNSIVTDNGWVSQYPPGHIFFLAIGLRLGVVWLVGPVMAALTVYFAARTAELLLPFEAPAVRLGALLLAISPFFIALSGAYMNHTTAAAFLAIAAFCAVRAAASAAMRRTAGWAAGAGLAAAVAFATRPLAALAMGSALVVGPWLAKGSARTVARNIAFAFAGAAPVLVALGWYNLHFFGAPHRFGYDVALGPATGLGFGVDPWGNSYGLREAIGWTGADLLGLSLAWLESPVPLVMVIGVYFLLAPRLPAGVRIFAAAALLQVLANLFYWHHGSFMGPRMLHEAAPWWLLLGSVAIVALVRRAPVEGPGMLRQYSPRTGLAVFFAAGILAGTLWLGPQRLVSYGGEWLRTMRLEVPHADGAALVFVHDAWFARLAMDLATNGVRLDEVETLLRQNDTCDVARLAGELRLTAPSENAALLADMDMVPRSEPIAPFFAPGSRIRQRSGAPLADVCIRQVRADRFGVYDIAPLVWLGDLPGAGGDGVLYVRDLGPERNAAALAAFGRRSAYVYAAIEEGGLPQLLGYEDGMRLLWSDDGRGES